MNKLILFGLLALLFNSINGDIACGDWMRYFNTSNLEDEEDICSSLTPTGTGYTHCCYMETNDQSNQINGCVELTDDTHCCYYDDGTSKSCVELKDDEYENIGRYIKYLESRGNDYDVDINCSSKFLSLSLFAVAALLF